MIWIPTNKEFSVMVLNLFGKLLKDTDAQAPLQAN